MDFRILIFFAYLAFDGALARSTFSSDSNSQQSSGPVTSSTNSKLWPNGTIPYEISSYFSEYSHQMIEEAMNHIHENSCVHFVEHTDEDVYTTILPGDDCSASIGYMEESKVILETRCIAEIGLIQHELMHVMGFTHEEIYRDQYIATSEENIEPDQLMNLDKKENECNYIFGPPCFYESVTYDSSEVSKSPHAPTMVTKENKNRKSEQNEKLDPIDIQKINAMYPCNDKSPMLKKNESQTENSHEIYSHRRNTNNEDINSGSVLDPRFSYTISNVPRYENSIKMKMTYDLHTQTHYRSFL